MNVVFDEFVMLLKFAQCKLDKDGTSGTLGQSFLLVNEAIFILSFSSLAVSDKSSDSL